MKPWIQSVGRQLLAAIVDNLPLLLATGLYLMAAYVADVFVYDRAALRGRFELGSVIGLLAATYHAGFLVCLSVDVMFRVRRDQRLFPAIGSRLAQYLDVRRIASFVLAVACIILVMAVFSRFKLAIPWIKPFCWDTTCCDWDEALHGGRHPWEWIQPLVGQPAITCAINFGYHLWFFVMFVILFWQAWSSDRELRRQFFVAFILTWGVLGTFAATWFSSAGPCYYGRVTGITDDPYAPLVSYLHQVNDAGYRVWALDVQQMLWSTYESGSTEFGKGISAMPSLHVATSVLFALLGWRTHRGLGIALTLFAVLIQVGSVHLAWHYAIDGYLAVPATLVIWWVAGWLTSPAQVRSSWFQSWRQLIVVSPGHQQETVGARNSASL